MGLRKRSKWKAGTGCDRARYFCVIFRVISCDIFTYFHTHIRIMQYFLTIKNPRYYVVSRNYVGFVQMEVMGLELLATGSNLALLIYINCMMIEKCHLCDHM